MPKAAVDKLTGLTQRELQVLVALTRGGTSRQLAQQLGVSPRTVQKHLQRIYAKLGVNGRVAAVLFMARQ